MIRENMVQADGSLVLVAALTDKKDKAAAVYRIMLNGMPEEFMNYLVRLYSAKSEGGVVLPGSPKSQGAQIKSEVYDKGLQAMMRAEEWVRSDEVLS